MTERLRPLPLLLTAIATLLLAALGATIAADETQALKCRPGQCLPGPEEPPAEEAPPAEDPPLPKPNPTMLVIGVGWEGSVPSVLESGLNAEYVDFFRGRFHEWFAQQAAPVPFKRWSVTNGGEYTIAPPVLPPGALLDPFDPDFRGCENLDFVDEIWARAEAKARQNGFDPAQYTTVVVQWHNQHCFAGVADFDKRHIGLTHPKHAFHEFGHYYGLGHANLLRCRDATGQIVSLSDKCTSLEYLDDWSAMGKYSADVAFNAINANNLGWLNGQFFDVAAGDFTRTYFLRPFTDPAHTERALRLVDGQQTLWLEYRTELGVDHETFSGHKFGPEQGLVVHRQGPGGASQLLDMTPGSKERETSQGLVVDPVADVEDAPLPVGQTWAVPGGEMKITLNSVSAAGASVTISPQRFPVPDFRGLTPSQAGAALEAAGLRSGGWSGTPDWFCNSIGRVVEQYPYAGTRVLPDTAISLTLGEEPPYCL